MKYTTLPRTDCKISTITLGTWVFGGDNWGPTKEEDCIIAVKTAIDCGINIIDTAPIYGVGKSEIIVGKAIKGQRDKIVIATKCGLFKKGNKIGIDLSADAIKKEIDDSLKRLQVDYVDLYQCHWPDPNTPLEETMEALLNLKEQGKIRHIGVSNFTREDLHKSCSRADILTEQVQYSLLERSIEKEIVPFCKEKDIGILTYGTLGGGILSGKYKTETHFKGPDVRNFFYKFYKGEAFNKSITLIKKMEAVGKPLYQTAINWNRQQPTVASVIVGCRNSEQVINNAKAADWDLSENELGSLS